MTGELPVPAEGPHLSSPENLPPGTTDDRRRAAPQSPNVTYLKELWHAIQTQDITGSDALLALTQRPLTTPRQRPAGRRRTCRSPRPIRRRPRPLRRPPPLRPAAAALTAA